MDKHTLCVDLNVHAETIAVAVAEEGREGEVRSLGRIPNERTSIGKLIKKLGGPKRLGPVLRGGALCLRAAVAAGGLVRDRHVGTRCRQAIGPPCLARGVEAGSPLLGGRTCPPQPASPVDISSAGNGIKLGCRT